MTGYEHIEGLLNAYGFEDKKPVGSGYRFSGNGSFVDVWIGRRGITFGFYNPRTQKVCYRRNLSLSDLEEELIKSSNKKQ